LGGLHWSNSDRILVGKLLILRRATNACNQTEIFAKLGLRFISPGTERQIFGLFQQHFEYIKILVRPVASFSFISVMGRTAKWVLQPFKIPRI